MGQHPHGEHHHPTATKNMAVALFLNLGFALLELIGGLWTNSVAILSDAVHDFGDTLSLAVAWRLQKVSERQADERYSYGYRRFSLLGALFISAVLLVGSVFIVRECVGRILEPQQPHVGGMLAMAVFGIVVNGAAALRLRRGSSLSERAVMLHLMEDVLGWIAVLVAGGVMYFVDLPILDPILSIGIAGWVLFNVLRNLATTFRILLQRTPSQIDTARLQQEIEALPGVDSIHDLHLWSLDGEYHVCTLHAVAAAGLSDARRLELKLAIRRIAAGLGIDHTTTEFETPNEECRQDCRHSSWGVSS